MTIKAEHHTAAYWENAKPRDERLGPPSPPGAILLHDFLEPLGISINQMAKDLGIPYKHAHDLTTGKRAITAMTALLLAKYLRTSPRFWLGLQSSYELERLRGCVGERMASVREIPRPDLDDAAANRLEGLAGGSRPIPIHVNAKKKATGKQ
jgi:addiction module HigA family antidote